MKIRQKVKKHPFWMLMLVVSILLLSACGGNGDGADEGGETKGEDGYEGTIVFADAGWDSIRFHNHVARTILEEGYGYKTDVKTGTTPATFLALRDGDIQAYMEIWKRSLADVYGEAQEAGEVKKVSVNFSDNKQGFYVPTYVIEGDPERGIEPMAPDLKSVKDLPQYWEVFKDPADPDKGRIVGSPPGWEADKIYSQKMKTYNLDENYNYFHPGSGTSLAASITKAFKSGDAWVGYYWEPTWIMGKYDMTLLQEPEFDEEIWNKNFGTEFPSTPVEIAVNSEFAEKAPKVVDFLSHYETSSALTNEALLYMQENEASAEEAAKWWMKEHKDLWTKWVPDDVASKVKEAIQ
jgi:glycine betaine/proline transport system substrate-binding protein